MPTVNGPDEITDLEAGNDKVFYSDSSGDVTEVALGAAATVLTSSGATSAPTFSAIPARASTPSTGERGGSCVHTACQTCAAAPAGADRPQGPAAAAGRASTSSRSRPPKIISSRARARFASRIRPARRRWRLPTWPLPQVGPPPQNRGRGKSPRACSESPASG